MNKTFKRVMSLFLCVLMAFGTAAFTLAAADPNSIKYAPEYYISSTDAQNAKVVLDKLDEVLAQQNIYEKVTIAKKTLLTDEVAITVDLRNINGLCSTIDQIKNLVNNKALWAVAKPFVGQLEDLKVDSWVNGMKRTGDDVKILKTLIAFAAENSELIGSFVGGNLDLGVIGKFVDVNALLGADGVHGKIMEALVGLVYTDKNSNEYKEACKNGLDKFVYTDVMNLLSKEDGALPGFSMDANTTIDQVLTRALASAWDKYIAPALKSIKVDWSGSSNEALKKLSSILVLNGDNFDLSTVKIDKNAKFADQINNILGQVAALFYPSISWTNGGIDKLAGNVETLYKDLAGKMGVKADLLSIVKYVIGSLMSEESIAASIKDYVGDYNSWTTMENAVAAVLRNTAAKHGFTVTQKASATYENILGDYLTQAMEQIVPLSYKAGSGTSIWTVLNDVANVYLFDKGFAKAFNLNGISKNSSIYEKLDAVIAMTGIFDGVTAADKNEYKSEVFITKLLKAVFSFDIPTAVEITAQRFLSDFGDKNAVKVVYEAVAKFLKSWFGTDIIAANFSTLDDVIKNSSLKTTVVNLLGALNSKKDSLIPPVLFIGALALNPVQFNVSDLTASDAAYTGKAITPSTIKAKDLTLKKGVDFEVTSIENNVKVGTATMNIKFIGNYKGTATVNFKIVINAPASLKTTKVSDTTITLSWGKVSGAKGYEVSYGSTKKTTTANSITLTKLKAATAYTVKVRAYNADKAYGASASVKTSTVPAQVKSLKVSAVTDTTATLAWAKASGVKTYVVYSSTDGKKWTKAATVKTNSAKLSKLKANTAYQFKVVAVNGNLVGTASAVVKATTAFALQVSTTSTTATVKWSAVKGAKSYVVYYSTDGKKWKSVKATKTTAKISKLAANKTYYFKVVAVNGKKTVSTSVTVKTATTVAAVTGLKATKKTKNSITLTWKKVTGANGYIVYRNGKAVSTIKKGSTVTFTDKKLKKNTTYKYTVKAYKTVAKKNVTGDASAVLAAKTTK